MVIHCRGMEVSVISLDVGLWYANQNKYHYMYYDIYCDKEKFLYEWKICCVVLTTNLLCNALWQM